MTSPSRAAVVYIVNSLNAGGTERLVVEMSRAFAPEFSLSVLCLDEPGTWAADLRSAGIPVHCLWRQPGLDLAIAARIARHCRETGARIVHAHQATPWFYGALSRLLYRAPRLLFEEHGRFYPESQNGKRIFVNRMLIRRLTHCSVAVSQDIRERLVRYEGLDARDIRVVYNGVRSEPALAAADRSRLRRELGIMDDDFVVGTVGRFDPIKNLPMLVDAIARASSADSRIAGLLVGDGPEFPAIRARVEAAGLSGRIRLTGFRQDARRIVQCADLFVLSSLSEGTSMALLEAMAAGLPVAVTAVGGNPEIVLAGESGWVVPSGDIDALAAAITAAAASPGLARRYALAGSRRFDEQFRLDTMIARYREIYRELLDTAERSGATMTIGAR